MTGKKPERVETEENGFKMKVNDYPEEWLKNEERKNSEKEDYERECEKSARESI